MRPRDSAARRATAVLIGVVLAVPSALAGPPALPDDEAAIVHALNRLAYGPRPGDVAKVRAMGLSKWIDRQLRPETIRDDAVDRRLVGLATLELSPSELIDGYDVPPEARKEIQRQRAALGDDPSDADVRRVRRELVRKYGGQMEGSPRQVVQELQSAKLLRAVYAERQLDEVLVDFWLNHFNVFAAKGKERFLVGEFEREVIRARAWGRFEDLLLATARSPAMLFYLDNWLSASPDAGPPGFRRFGRRWRGRAPGSGDEEMRRGGQGRKRGLNENYAREIMELHTLGVDGGYSQKDVTEVARCFTGWTIRGLRQGRPEFAFVPALHDKKDKVVLGRVIRAGGRDEGEAVVHLLATHPATARFLAFKLARRFVADEPPPALVDRAALVFRRTDGDVREVVRAIVTSPEFFAAESRSAKVKTPLEFVVSAVRASGAEVEDARDLARRLHEMGMPLYLQQPPTGYKDTAEAWVSTSGLLARLNFALDLASGKVRGVRVASSALAPPAGRPVVDTLAARLAPAGLSESTRKTLSAEAVAEPARLAGLILGSPEFQRK